MGGDMAGELGLDILEVGEVARIADEAAVAGERRLGELDEPARALTTMLLALRLGDLGGARPSARARPRRRQHPGGDLAPFGDDDRRRRVDGGGIGGVAVDERQVVIAAPPDRQRQRVERGAQPRLLGGGLAASASAAARRPPSADPDDVGDCLLAGSADPPAIASTAPPPLRFERQREGGCRLARSASTAGGEERGARGTSCSSRSAKRGGAVRRDRPAGLRCRRASSRRRRLDRRWRRRAAALAEAAQPRRRAGAAARRAQRVCRCRSGGAAMTTWRSSTATPPMPPPSTRRRRSFVAEGREIAAGVLPARGRALASGARHPGRPSRRASTSSSTARAGSSSSRGAAPRRRRPHRYARDFTDLENVQAELARHIAAHADVLENVATAIAIYGPDHAAQIYNTRLPARLGRSRRSGWPPSPLSARSWSAPARAAAHPGIRRFPRLQEAAARHVTSLIEPV